MSCLRQYYVNCKPAVSESTTPFPPKKEYPKRPTAVKVTSTKPVVKPKKKELNYAKHYQAWKKIQPSNRRLRQIESQKLRIERGNKKHEIESRKIKYAR